MTICRERVQGLYTSNQGLGPKGAMMMGKFHCKGKVQGPPPPLNLEVKVACCAFS